MTETTRGWTSYRNPAWNLHSNMQRVMLLRSRFNHLTQSPGLFISIIYMSTLPLFMERKEREKGKDITLFIQLFTNSTCRYPWQPPLFPNQETWNIENKKNPFYPWFLLQHSKTCDSTISLKQCKVMLSHASVNKHAQLMGASSQ